MGPRRAGKQGFASRASQTQRQFPQSRSEPGWNHRSGITHKQAGPVGRNRGDHLGFFAFGPKVVVSKRIQVRQPRRVCPSLMPRVATRMGLEPFVVSREAALRWAHTHCCDRGRLQRETLMVALDWDAAGCLNSIGRRQGGRGGRRLRFLPRGMPRSGPRIQA